MSADTKNPSKEMDNYFILESDPQISAKWGKKYDIKLIPQCLGLI